MMPLALSRGQATDAEKFSMRLGELVTRARSNEDLSPSDHHSYARYLGLDDSDSQFLWISEEALSSPLPEDWSEHVDDQGRIYFYNAVSQNSSWIHPLEADFRKLIKTSKSVYSRAPDANSLLQSLRDEVKQLDRSLNTKLRLYQEYTDPQSGRQFFYNVDTGRSYWSDPRLALIHLLRVKSKVLEILNSHLPALAPHVSAPSATHKRSRPLLKTQAEPADPLIAADHQSRPSGVTRESPKFGRGTDEHPNELPGIFQPGLTRKKAVGVRLAPLNIS